MCIKNCNYTHRLMKRLILLAVAIMSLSTLYATEPITSVSLAFEDTTVYVGSILEIPFTYAPTDGDPEELIWISSNTDGFSPNKNAISIYRPGETTITVKDFSGSPLATCHISAIYRAQGQCGDHLYWSINNDYKLEFWADAINGYKTSTDPSYYDMWDFNTTTNPAPWAPYADKITELYLYNVERIGNNAFRDMPNLFYVILYDGFSLGDSVFYGSTNLSTLEVRADVPPLDAPPSSLLLDKESGQEVKVIIVPNETAVVEFNGDPIWGTAGRIISVGSGEWIFEENAQIHWEIGQSDSLRSLKLQIGRSWDLPYDNKEPQIIPDMDTTSILPPWHELRDNVEDLIISDRISYIGLNAFASLTNIQTVQFRQMEDQLDSIHLDAFAHTIKPWKFALGDPQDGPIVPPTVVGLTGEWETVLAHFAEETVLYVPDSLFDYKGDKVRAVDLYKEAPFWSLFNRITDRTVAVDDVTAKSAVMTWLPLENAYGYRLTISKKGCATCDTTIFIPALGGKGLIDWEHIDLPSYVAPRRQRRGDDGNGGLVVVLEIKKGSGSASNEDVEVSASALNPSSDYTYTREVLLDKESINQKLTKQGSFSTPEKPAVYTVTFTDKDGNTIKTEDVEDGQAATAPDDKDIPAVEGYHFTGWDKAFNNITADLAVKAQYEINKYKVVFVDWDDKELKSEEIEHGSAATAPKDPEREGYTFTGWDKKFDNITSDLTVKAQYEINKYKVVFVDWDDKELTSEEVEHGSAATAPKDPTREGYHFTGWDKKFDNITADLTVKAQYEINKYEVVFLDWDDTELKKEDVEYGKSAAAPMAPTREGYTFTGWDKKFDNITADLTVKAQYEIKTFSVKFFDKDGNQIGETQTVNWNEAAVAPSDPVWEGHTFTGWSAAFDHVKSDLDIKPIFDVETYAVTFLGFNDVELKKENVEYGKAATAPTAPEVTGYTFKNWDKEFSNITGNLTVKAVYEINKYKVVFADWDDKELKSEEVEHGKSATAPKDPSREGYTFIGWDKKFDNITADLTVKAQYEEVVVVDYTPKNLKAVMVPKDDDVLITLSWDKVEGAISYDLRVSIGEKDLFMRNTMTLNVIATKLSDIEKDYELTPGTFTIDWEVRSTDMFGKAISDWAKGNSFEVTVKDPATGIDEVESQKSKVESQKLLINGKLFILREGNMYDASGVKIQ